MYSNILDNQLSKLNSCIDDICNSENIYDLEISKIKAFRYLQEIYKYNFARLDVQEINKT